MAGPLLSVVIPTFNGLHHLRRCIPALLEAVEHAGGDSQVIVVDDGSDDGTAAWLRRQHAGIELLVLAENGGFAAAANAGLRSAEGRGVALLNNDVIVDRNWIRAALAGDLPPEVGSIATQILFLDPPDTINSAGDEYASCGFALPGRAGEKAGDTGDDSPRMCFCACAAACFYRRSALERVGLFRQRFEAYYEDVDLGFRLNLAGYGCRYVPRSRCRHVVGATYGRSWKVHYNSSRNRELVFWGNMPGRLLAGCAAAHVLVVLLQLARGVFNGELLPRSAGVLAAILRAGEILAIRRHAEALRVVTPIELKRRFTAEPLGAILTRRLRRPAGKSVALGRQNA